jgi:hypothetical protein
LNHDTIDLWIIAGHAMPSPYHTGQVMRLIFLKYTTIPGYFATMVGKERIDFGRFAHTF